MNQLLLTEAQAVAIYSAMCALNNVGGAIDVRLNVGNLANTIRVFEDDLGSIVVARNPGFGEGVKFESHRHQDAFAKAYSIVN